VETKYESLRLLSSKKRGYSENDRLYTTYINYLLRYTFLNNTTLLNKNFLFGSINGIF